jgi:predicted nucleic acid-binding protein
MIVVDTNILAYLLIDGDNTKQAQALYGRDADWRSEGFLLIEFSNILATYQRTGALSRNAVESMLANAEQVVSGLVNVPHSGALEIAMEYGVSAYDARFLGAARSLGARLVTEDARLRAAAPRLTHSLADALSA